MKRYVRSSSISEMSRPERVKLAKSSNDPEILAKLADDEYDYIRELVVTRTNDPAILAKLADDEDYSVRAEVAYRTNDPEILAKLANDEDDYVRKYVAWRTDDPRLLAKLASDEAWHVRVEVAERTDDPAILAKLADDEDEVVREVVAKHTNDPEILAKLANDEYGFVREAVANRRRAQVQTSKPKWASIIEQLEDDYDGIRDPFYEQTEAADYILGLASEVDSSLGYYVEPSVQAGQGGIWIYDENNDNEVLVDDYDFATFNEEISKIAFDSKSAADFKKKYKQYLLSLVDNR